MNLTPKQRDLMRFLQRYVDEHACCPTFSEMQDALGLASKSGIDRLLGGLERRGFVQRLPHMQRAITILKRVKEPEDDARAALRSLATKVLNAGLADPMLRLEAQALLERFP